MSFAAAIDQVATIIKGTTPGYETGTFGDAFAYVPDADLDDRPAASRVFWLDIQDIATNAAFTYGSGTRTFVSLDVFIAYERVVNSDQILKAIAADYVALRARLMNPANWNQPTSTMVAVSREGKEILLAGIIRTDAGRVMNFRIPLEYTEQIA